MSEYEEKTLPELYEAWINNWKVVRAGLREMLGDSPMPDPREIANMMVEMPENIWVGMFQSARAAEDFKRQMDIQELLANVQLENVQILNAALQIGKS